MQTPDLVSVVLDTSYTTSEVAERLALMRRFLEDAYFSADTTPTAERLEEFLDGEGVSDSASRSALAAWLSAWAGALSRRELYRTLEAVEHGLAALPVLDITVPVRLAQEEIGRLGAWVRKYVDRHALLALRTDPEAVGGCRLAWHGAERDFSLRYFLEKHRSEVVEEVRQAFAQKTG